MDPLEPTILHVDMDAFFAAIEQRDNPELRGKPVIVGSPPDRRGVVAAASYEARRFGVHSAMPSRTAFKHCPQGIFLPVRRDRYSEVSKRLMALLRQVTPMVEPLSVDEAFLDVSSVLRQVGTAVAAARGIKDLIRKQLQLTASVGVARNKFLAKLASDVQKPDGLTVVPTDADDIMAFLAPLPVTRIWGVGAVAERRLLRHGVRSIGDLQELTLSAAVTRFGPRFGSHIWRLARGIDDRPVLAGTPEEKSISHEETFAEDCPDPAHVRQVLLTLTEKVGRRLRASGKIASVLFIKLRFSDFKTITRQTTVAPASDSDRALLRVAAALFERENIRVPIRLVGVGVTDLTAEDGGRERQPLLFEAPEHARTQRERALDRAVDALRDAYGHDIIQRGT